MALLPIIRPIGQATAATRAPSTATLKAMYSIGGDQRPAEPTRAVAQEAMLRRLRVGDRRVEPVDHVRRGVARSVVDPGQRPRRRGIVAAGDGSQPTRLRHDPGPFELVEGAEGEGRGADTATRAAHAEIGGRRQFTHGDRLVLPAVSASPTPCAWRSPAGTRRRHRADRGRRRASSARPSSTRRSARRGCRDT